MRTLILSIPFLLILTMPGCSLRHTLPDRETCQEETAGVDGDCNPTADTDTENPPAETDSEETETDTTAEPDPNPAPLEPVTPLALAITSPATASSYEEEEALTFSGTLSNLTNHTEYNEVTLTWTSSLDGPLHTEVLLQDGGTWFTTTDLSPGIHTITLTASHEDEDVANITTYIGICGWILIEDFESDLSEEQWRVYHNAYRDDRGWLELTGNATARKGHIFSIGESLSPGNTRLHFDISTGQCDTIGTCYSSSCAADGFAASVYNVNSVEELDAIISTAQNGGGLGFHQATPPVAESFHIEFDTWHNGYDPTSADHVAIHLNSDSHTPFFYSPVTELEDNNWHSVILDINGALITVDLDGTTIISGEIPEYSFKGGLIGFSGTTGACTNYHRIDNLSRQPQCTFD